MKVLVTGAAGHIGAEVTKVISDNSVEVLGIDSFTDYYSPEMKRKRIEALGISHLVKPLDIANALELNEIFSTFRPTHVINLAARAGVRSTWEQFNLYNHSNVLGFQNLIETSKNFGVEHFIFASSSSVYGEGIQPPFSESEKLSIPKSYYALTKIGNEIVARAAGFDLKCTGLRFFTVYGPWGRPDMATLQFLTAGLLQRKATLTGDLETKRDFTFVKDVAHVVWQILDRKVGDSFEVLNVAGGRPQSLSDMLAILRSFGMNIEREIGHNSNLDVPITHGDTKKLRQFVNFVPSTLLKDGLSETISWAKSISPSDLSKWVTPPPAK
jgi:UDP-glucuronate 4-epimerase